MIDGEATMELRPTALVTSGKTGVCAGTEAVRSLKAYLATITARLSLNRLRDQRARAARPISGNGCRNRS